MQVHVNGEPKDVADGATLSALLEVLELRVEQVAVEVNRELVTRSRHAETVLADGDRVEIVTLVGGG